MKYGRLLLVGIFIFILSFTNQYTYSESKNESVDQSTSTADENPTKTVEKFIEKNSVISLENTNDYHILNSTLPEKLDQFTISAWVKPDYKRGAPAILSIASAAHAFDLSINNDKVDKNVALFSIYDGIKWHQVKSKSEIFQNWTYLSATY